MTTKTKGDFEQKFSEKLEDIYSRSEKAKTSITEICRDAGIARATPDRWRKRAPKSIKLIDQLDAALKQYE